MHAQKGFPSGSEAAGDMGSIPGWGRGEYPMEESRPLQYSCPENPMDRGAWWATVHSIARSGTRLKQLRVHACTYI